MLRLGGFLRFVRFTHFGLRKGEMIRYNVMSSGIETSQPIKKQMGFLRFANAPVEMTKDNGRNDEWFIIVMSPSRSPKGLPARRDPDRIKKICIIDFAIIHIFYVA